MILFIAFSQKTEAKNKCQFHQYQISYQQNLEKYQKMVKKQKRILWKKQLQLFLYTVLLKIKEK